MDSFRYGKGKKIPGEKIFACSLQVGGDEIERM